VVESGRLESVCTGNRTGGSNPSLTANLRRCTPLHDACDSGWQANLTNPFNSAPRVAVATSMVNGNRDVTNPGRSITGRR
jgi:hypothetical protein